MLYVIDAHVLIWFLERNPKLPVTAASLRRDTTAEIVVPTIVLAEIAHRHGRGRIATSPAAARALIGSLSNATIAPFDEDVLNLMPAGLEIHDAIIVATALAFSGGGRRAIRVVTNDQQIAASRLVDVVW